MIIRLKRNPPTVSVRTPFRTVQLKPQLHVTAHYRESAFSEILSGRRKKRRRKISGLRTSTRIKRRSASVTHRERVIVAIEFRVGTAYCWRAASPRTERETASRHPESSGYVRIFMAVRSLSAAWLIVVTRIIDKFSTFYRRERSARLFIYNVCERTTTGRRERVRK